MALTEHQDDVMNQVIDAIKSGHRRIVLKGSAGVGKTYMVNELVKKLGMVNNTYLTAPTNKALAVLRGKINILGNLEFSTIHSALKLRRKFDKDTGDPYFEQSFHPRYPPFAGCKLLIVDEASMINNMLLGYLKDYNFPMIFIGDEKQLNPVKEEESPVFHQNWITFELTEIIRQGEGNPIIDLSRDIKSIWNKNSYVVQDAGYVFTEDRPKIIERLAEVNGTDELKYLAWSNAEVDIMNSSVRNKVYGTPKMIEQGETLVFNNPYKEGEYYTNQEILIQSLEEYEGSFIAGDGKVSLKVYRVNENIVVVQEDSIRDFRKVASVLKADVKKGKYDWRTYYGFVENFADFKYNHAITVHKSQGSTYKDVILNVKNLNMNKNNKEKQRLFYTGITRASNLLILYNV